MMLYQHAQTFIYLSNIAVQSKYVPNTKNIGSSEGKTSKTTFNNDQQRSGKEKDLWLETLFRD